MAFDIETAVELAKTAIVSAAVAAGTSVCVSCGGHCDKDPLSRSERDQREKEKKAIIAARNSPEALAREAADAKERAELDARLMKLHKRSMEFSAHYR